MMRRYIVHAVLALVLLRGATCPLFAITLAPVVDFQTQGNSSSASGGQSGGTSLNFRYINSPRSEYRFGMEFPLAGIPSTHVIAGVTWRGTTTTVTGNSLLEFHGYSGNGTFSSSDTYNSLNLLGEKVGVTPGVEHSVSFDPAYLSSLVGTATYLGVYARERNDGASGFFASRTTVTPPRLDVLTIDPLAPNSNRWVSSGNPSWNVTSHWSLGIPIASDDIFIRPTAPSVVQAPNSHKTVNTLTLGGGGASAELILADGFNFVSNGITTLAAGGILHLGDSTYTTGGFNSAPGGAIDWGSDGVLAVDGGWFSTPVSDFVVDGSGTPTLALLGTQARKQSTATTNRMVIGNTGGGFLLVAEQSDIRLRTLSVASQTGSRGDVQVEDSGTLLQVAGLTEVGANGDGDMSVEQGARLEAGLIFVGSTIQGISDNSTTDRLTITGAGTTAKLSGFEANAKSMVEIKNGAVVETGSVGGAGDATQPPVVRVTGPGSRVTVNDRIQMGSTFSANGKSVMFVESGGRVDTKLLILGIGSHATNGTSNSELTITGASSQVNTTDRVFFGGLRDAVAKIDILDGGVLRAGAETFMSATIGTVAAARVSGAGSRWEQTGELHVGGVRDLNSALVDLGPANLDIDAGGAVAATGAVNIMQRGTVNLQSGLLESPIIRHDRGGQFNFTGGTLVVDDFYGNLLHQGGTLAAGNSPGFTTIHGDYTLETSGALEVEIASAGTPGVGFDRYNVSGHADLRGTLDVKLLDGFVPALGDSFAFLSGQADLSAAFATTNLPMLPAGLSWQINPGGTTLFLNVVAVTLGDFNSNGIVDAADYVLWRKSPGTYGGNPTGYTAWRANFGRPPGSRSSSAVSSSPAVPEPATVVLLLFAAAGCCLRRGGPHSKSHQLVNA